MIQSCSPRKSRRARVSDAELSRLREIDAERVLHALCEHVRVDADFIPLKSKATKRFHAMAGGRHFEILCTGPKWFDTRIRRGGGGAIDLAMHLYGLDFRGAIQMFQDRL